MSTHFADHTVVVTGGTGALGQAVVGHLLSGGATVVVPVFAEGEVESFEHRGHDRVRLVMDANLSDESVVARVYDEATTAAREAGQERIWASIHIAGGFAMGPIGDSGSAVINKMLAMNTATAYLCCREAAGRMADAGGRIVNVSAKPGETPEQGARLVAYAASKAAVSAITKALAAEVRETGVWVNAVAPSIIDTPANREAMPDADFAAWPTPAEIAETICYLASRENRVTTGAVLPVGGRT